MSLVYSLWAMLALIVVIIAIPIALKIPTEKTFILGTKDESFEYVEWYVKHNFGRKAKIVSWECSENCINMRKIAGNGSKYLWRITVEF